MNISTKRFDIKQKAQYDFMSTREALTYAKSFPRRTGEGVSFADR
jgi:hypothetical protein